MCKTPTSTNRQTKSETKRKVVTPRSTIERTSSARSRSRIKTSQTEVSAKAKDSGKKNNNDNEPSCDSASDMSGDEHDKPPTKSRDNFRPSVVHEFSTKLSVNEYECKICSKVIRCGTDTNSNIRRHLANIHGKTQLHCKSFRSARITGVAPQKKKILDEAAVRCIIVDARGFGDFRRPGFQSFLKVAVPGYYGPSSRTVQRNMARLYGKKRIELKNQLASVPYVSMTADLWRSARNRSFLCMTAHYISIDDHNLHTKVLSFRHFHGRHFSCRLRAHMRRVLMQFDLMDKVTAITTDNGADMKSATQLLRLFGVRFHCMAHALNLTVQKALCLWPKKKPEVSLSSSPMAQIDDESNSLADDSFESDDDDNDEQWVSAPNDESESTDDDDEDEGESSLVRDDDLTDSDDDNEDESRSVDPVHIGELLKKCRIIISTIRKSSILHDTVLLLARNSSIEVELIMDMRIRWNSSFKMIHRLLFFQPVLEHLYTQLDSLTGITIKQRAKLIDSRLSNQDWTLLRTLRRILERFTDATEILSGKNYPTLSLAYAVVFSLAHYLNDQTDDDIEWSIKQMLQTQFDYYMVMPSDSKQANMMRIAALLDPFVHDLMSPDDKEAAEKSVIAEVKQKSKKLVPASAATQVLATDNDADKEATSSADISKTKGGVLIKKLYNKCGINAGTFAAGSTKSPTIQQELAKLASIPKDNYDFTSFWREHHQAMPKLAALARKYLAISASSVPSESAFSVANYVLRKNRLALTSRNLKYTMFLKDKLD